MNNRTMFLLTGVVLISMLLLLALNLTSILTGTPPSQTYLKYNQVRGMEVGHKDLLYTLNFKQQNDVIDILNRSVRVVALKPGNHQKPDIDKIVVYQFDNHPPITITPIMYIDNVLVYSVPEWNPDGYLMEISDGSLRQLLSQTYDP